MDFCSDGPNEDGLRRIVDKEEKNNNRAGGTITAEGRVVGKEYNANVFSECKEDGRDAGPEECFFPINVCLGQEFVEESEDHHHENDSKDKPNNRKEGL